MVIQKRKILNKARQRVKHTRGRKAKRFARLSLRRAKARYNRAVKQLKIICYQEVVVRIYKSVHLYNVNILLVPIDELMLK